jgi:hypothetical protein
MTALPPPLESSRQRGRAAGIGAVALGVVVAIGVALLFVVVIGAGRVSGRARAQLTALAPTRRGIRGAGRLALLPDDKSIKPLDVLMVILDVTLVALVRVVIMSFSMSSVYTQYRDAGCEHLHVRRPLRVNVKVVEAGTNPTSGIRPELAVALPKRRRRLLAQIACIQWQAADRHSVRRISRRPLTVINQEEVLS